MNAIYATPERIKRLTNDWSNWGGEPVRVEVVGTTIYGYGSELAALRLFHKYHKTPGVRVGVSQVDGGHYFSLLLQF